MIEIIRKGRKRLIRATCGQCGGHEEIEVHHLHHERVILESLHAAGWDVHAVDGGMIEHTPTTCPTCVRKNRERRENMGIRKATDKSIKTDSVSTPSPSAVDGSFKTVTLLQEYFDKDAGEYLHGYSDERVAKEAGMAVDYVRGMRTKHFGPLAAPKKLKDFETELENLRIMFDQLQGEFERTKKQNGWK